MSTPQGQPENNQFAQNQFDPSQGAPQGYGQQQAYGQPQYAAGAAVSDKQKIVAGILGIFLGSLGIHNFYIGKTNRGILQLVLSLLTAGIAGIWGFIEGILILVSKPGTPWHQDAAGRELQD